MRPLRFAGHPVHPTLTDFPVALLTTAVLWDLVALVTGGALWWTVAFWTLALGVATLLPAAVTGMWDLLALPQDSPAGPTALRHMAAVLVSGSLYAASLLVRGGPAPPGGSALVLAPVLGGAGLVALVVGGWLGGSLVFRHGLGRSESP